jgi:hypothetical protein
MSELVYGWRMCEGPFLAYQPRPAKPPLRRCQHPGCEAWLCRYNPGATCWHHAQRPAFSDEDADSLMRQNGAG